MDFKSVGRIVVKVGTSTLTYDNGKLNIRRIEHLVRVISDLKNCGKEIVIVTSGAVALGMSRLSIAPEQRDMSCKQAAAAVGQSELMNIYGRLFSEYGHQVAQLLLTRDVTETDEIKTNVKNVFERLLNLGVVPIVNENDSVSIFELSKMHAFGDNDTLAAVVAELCGAGALILLSDTEGLYDSNPRENEGARLIPLVRDITDEIENAAKGAGTARGKGGMATKLSAAKTVISQGIPMVIASGERPEILYDIAEGKFIGTTFLPK